MLRASDHFTTAVYLVQCCPAPVSEGTLRLIWFFHDDDLRGDFGGAEHCSRHEAAGGHPAVPRFGRARGPAAGLLPRGSAGP